MKRIITNFNKTTKKSGSSRAFKLIPLIALSFAVFILVSCSFVPEWNFTFSEEIEDTSNEEEEEHQSHGETLKEVSLEWDPNTEPDLEGYKLYYGSGSGNYDYTIDVGNQTSYTVTDLQAGETYYFAVTAYNTTGYESGYSNEIEYLVPTGG